jgi:hypothetical protein
MSRLSTGFCGTTLVRADTLFAEHNKYITMDKALLYVGKRRFKEKASARQEKKNRKRYKRENPRTSGE